MSTINGPSPNLQEKAEILRTIGHPLRLKIMARLADRCCCVRDLWECLHLPQAIVSQHLRILKDRGVVVANRDGVRVCYSLRDDLMKNLVKILILH